MIRPGAGNGTPTWRHAIAPMRQWLRPHFPPIAAATVLVLAISLVSLVLATSLPLLGPQTIAGVAFATSAVLAIGSLATFLAWCTIDKQHAVNWVNLAIAILCGAVIGVMVFALQLSMQAGNDERNFRLLIGSTSDLVGFSPPRDTEDRPLGGPYSLENVHLRGKKLEQAFLDDTDMRRSNLAFAHVGGAQMIRTNLEGAYLRGAYFYYADLRCACLRGANLINADLRNVDLRGADLRGATLDGADLRGVLVGPGTRFGPDGTQTLAEAARAPEVDACVNGSTCTSADEARGSHDDTTGAAKFGRTDPAKGTDPPGCEPIS